jgi:hypothetical protein
MSATLDIRALPGDRRPAGRTGSNVDHDNHFRA